LPPLEPAEALGLGRGTVGAIELLRGGAISPIRRRAFEFVPYIPAGQLVGRRAFRKSLAGVLDAPLPFLWNIEKL